MIGNIGFGLINPQDPNNNYIDYHGKDGAVVGRTKGYYQKMNEGQPYKEGALVSMEVNLSAGFVTWSVNGGEPVIC